jgi:hypothetical protein
MAPWEPIFFALGQPVSSDQLSRHRAPGGWTAIASASGEVHGRDRRGLGYCLRTSTVPSHW